ncbi:MAG: DegV family protein [Acidobacteriota bacterium]
MRPSILLIDPDDDRRRALASGLAERGYEVVPAGSSQEGARFAQGLGPSVIVGPAELPTLRDASILSQMSNADGTTLERTLVLLGLGQEPDDLPDDARFIAIGELDYAEILRRIRLVLVGREVGLQPDIDLRYLVGDVALTPLIDVARALHRCLVNGRLEISGAKLAFQRGQFVHASFGVTTGSKAFCRLARLESQPFRIHLGPQDLPKNLEDDLDILSLQALEEANLEMPDPRAQILLTEVRKLPSGELTPHEALIARAITENPTVGALLDSMPVRDGLAVQALNKMMQRGALRLERPRAAVRIITDSTSDIPPALAAEHDIVVVPLAVNFGEVSLRDGIDIKPRDFYQMLTESEHHPTTEPPAEAVFYEHFHDLIEHQDLVSLHISGRMSKTHENAQKAALRGIRTFSHLPATRADCALEVMDGQSVSMGLGIQAIFAARMAMRGQKVFAIAHRLRAIAPRIQLFFAVDTLEFLARGGRIGRAKALVGKLLGIKPILGVEKGEVVPVDRARGGRRVQPKMVQLLAERLDPKRPIIVCVAHAQAPVWADRLRKQLEKKFKILELILADIGPVVGTHAGPGCVGFIAFQPTEEEIPLVGPLRDDEASKVA